MVNNAGVAVMATVEDLSWDDFEWIMLINVWGVMHGTKAFLLHLIAAGDGHVVNLSSVFCPVTPRRAAVLDEAAGGRRR